MRVLLLPVATATTAAAIQCKLANCALLNQALPEAAWKDLCAKLSQKYGTNAWAVVQNTAPIGDASQPEPEPSTLAGSDAIGGGGGGFSESQATDAEKRRVGQVDVLTKFYAKHEPTKGRVRVCCVDRFDVWVILYIAFATAVCARAFVRLLLFRAYNVANCHECACAIAIVGGM